MSTPNEFNMVEMLIFKSPSRVDWKATDDAIAAWVLRQNPEARISEQVMWIDYIERKLREIARRKGVRRLYNLYHGTQERIGVDTDRR